MGFVFLEVQVAFKKYVLIEWAEDPQLVPQSHNLILDISLTTGVRNPMNHYLRLGIRRLFRRSETSTNAALIDEQAMTFTFLFH